MKETLNLIIPADKYINLYAACGDDMQSKELLMKISIKLNKLMEMSDNEFCALCRLRNLAMSASSEYDSIRNQVFKVANELGLPLPSSMF